MTAIKIPYDQLSTEALHGVIEEFASRDGTDYGEREISVETKIDKVLTQIKSEKAVIVFDQESETYNILRSDDSVLREKGKRVLF